MNEPTETLILQPRETATDEELNAYEAQRWETLVGLIEVYRVLRPKVLDEV